MRLWLRIIIHEKISFDVRQLCAKGDENIIHIQYVQFAAGNAH